MNKIQKIVTKYFHGISRGDTQHQIYETIVDIFDEWVKGKEINKDPYDKRDVDSFCEQLQKLISCER